MANESDERHKLWCFLALAALGAFIIILMFPTRREARVLIDSNTSFTITIESNALSRFAKRFSESEAGGRLIAVKVELNSGEVFVIDVSDLEFLVVGDLYVRNRRGHGFVVSDGSGSESIAFDFNLAKDEAGLRVENMAGVQKLYLKSRVEK